MVRVLYHMHVLQKTRHSRKVIGKSVGEAMVEHMSEVEWKFLEKMVFLRFLGCFNITGIADSNRTH